MPPTSDGSHADGVGSHADVVGRSRNWLPGDEDIERALRRAWFPVARSCDLDSPRRVELLGEWLAVFRTDAGAPAALADRCPHRGAALSGGRVQGDCIVCPYHGWRWRAGDGACTRVPSLANDGAVPARAVAHAFSVQERYGLVWTCLEQPAVALPASPLLEREPLTFGAGPPLPVAAGLRSSTENVRDVAHFPFVHAATMGDVPESVPPLAVEGDGIEVTMTLAYAARGGNERFWHGDMSFAYHAIAPGFVALAMDHDAGARRVLVSAPCPHTPPTAPGLDGRHRITIFFAEGLSAGFTRATLEEVLEEETRIYREDNVVLERIEPSEAPLDSSLQVHAPSDRYTLAYRRAFVEFVARTAGVPTAPERRSAAREVMS